RTRHPARARARAGCALPRRGETAAPHARPPGRPRQPREPRQARPERPRHERRRQAHEPARRRGELPRHGQPARRRDPPEHAVQRHRPHPRPAHAGRLRLHPVHRPPRGHPVSTTTVEDGTRTRAQTLRNRFGFGIGTIGRDAGYTLISMFLLFYLSDILTVSTPVFASVTVILVAVRVFDAVIDPFVGVLVDNTRTRWGKFKPWILVGVVVAGVLMLLLFTPVSLDDAAFVVVFSAVYLAWSVAFAANDIGYWSMLPALTQQQAERERIGAFARICASIGTFGMVVSIVPLSSAIGEAIGDIRWSFFYVALGVVVLTIALQGVMLLMTREDRSLAGQPHTMFRELLSVIFRNDQLLAIAVAFVLFNIAFAVTTNFGIYYFKYVRSEE